MEIRAAEEKDWPFLHRWDPHLSGEELRRSIQRGQALLAIAGGEPAGWLRYNLFWDNTPFLNLLYVLEPLRGRLCGSALLGHWEEQMRRAGYPCVMTSTAAHESAQHFYMRHGYRAVGGFFPYGEPYELILCKEFRESRREGEEDHG